MVRLAQTVHLSRVKIRSTPISRQDSHYLHTDQNVLPLEPCQLGVPSGASKMILEPMVRLAHTVHVSCTDTNNVSKRPEMRFNMTHVT
jgi:hypothetical protein